MSKSGTKRIQLKKPFIKDLGKGSAITYQAGRLYFFDKKLAETLIKEGVAIDPTAKKVAKPKEAK